MPEDQHKEDPSTEKKEGALKPDEETLHTTDPQEHMTGPISSLMQKTGEGLDSDKKANESEDEDK